MNYLKKIVLLCTLLIVLALMAGHPLSAETQVSISTSDNLAYIGDRLHIKFIVKTNEAVDKINLKAEKGEFETLAEEPSAMRKQQDYTIFEKNIQIAFFKTGEFNIGPYEIQLIKNDQVIQKKITNSIPVTIKTSLAEEDKDIKNLKGPMEVKGNPFYILKYALIAIAIVVLIVFLVLWWKKRKENAIPLPETLLEPLEELEVRLRDLRQKNLFGKGKLKLHFIELTRIFKHFLLRKYHFQAEDYTTYETMYALEKKESQTDILDNLRFIFNTADLVKFARFEPDHTMNNDITDRISQIVAAFKKRLARVESAQGTRKQEIKEIAQ